MTEALFSLITASFLLLGTPGPATLSLAAIGATYGVRNGIPFLAGILVGLCAIIVGATLGLAALFAAFPGAKLTVQILGAMFISFIAFKIATAPHTADSVKLKGETPRFRDGFILNILNAKAYAVFLALFSQFTLPMANANMEFIATALVCFVVGVVVDICWLGFGSLLRPFMRDARHARILRITFAILMLITVGWALFNYF